MKKTILALGIVCVTLAGLDVKLLLDLRAVRAQRAATSGPAADHAAAAPAAGPGASTDGAASGSASGADQPGRTLADIAAARARPSAEQRARAAELLRKYQDPRERQELLDEMDLHLRNRYRGMDRALGIESGRWKMFSERLARAEIDGRERRARCEVDPACPPGSGEPNWSAEYDRVAREVLGETKAEEFNAYGQTLRERRQVEALQSRLQRDVQLSTDRANQLIMALADEGRRVRQEWRVPSPGGPDGFGLNDLGMLSFPRGAPIEEQFAAGTEYSNRMRQRAATLLNPQQRAAYDAMQEELLRNFQRSWRDRRGGG